MPKIATQTHSSTTGIRVTDGNLQYSIIKIVSGSCQTIPAAIATKIKTSIQKRSNHHKFALRAIDPVQECLYLP